MAGEGEEREGGEGEDIPLKPWVVLDQWCGRGEAALGRWTRGRAAKASWARPSVVVSEMLAGPRLLAGSQVNLNGRVAVWGRSGRGPSGEPGGDDSDGADMAGVTSATSQR